MLTCSICYAQTRSLSPWRDRYLVCRECKEAGEFYDAMTPAERRHDDELQARYVETTQGENL